MGKKTHPAAIRIDFTGWQQSLWYARGKNFANGIKEDHFLRKLCFEFFENEVVCNVTIERIAGSIIVSLHTHRPGVLIGEKGINIEKLKKTVLEKLNISVKINVVEVYRPEANAQFICDQIVRQLINRADYKRVAKNCMKFAMKSSIVKGVSIIVSGRLGGASIARIERFRVGSVAMQTFRDKIVYCKKAAKTIFGMCGVKVYVSYFGNPLGNAFSNDPVKPYNNERRPYNGDRKPYSGNGDRKPYNSDRKPYNGNKNYHNNQNIENNQEIEGGKDVNVA